MIGDGMTDLDVWVILGGLAVFALGCWVAEFGEGRPW